MKTHEQLRVGYCVIISLADDFSPVLSLRHEELKVWPLRLPNVIVTSSDSELQRILIEFRESQKKKCILHSNNRNVVMNVLKAVSLQISVYFVYILVN